MGTIIYLIIALGAGIFLARTLFFSIGFWLGIFRKLPKMIDVLPFVSVIVPARNEESNIENSINSIATNDYPTDKFEIIAVNDRSSDSTGLILTNLQKRFPNLKVVEINNETMKKNLRGKPGALQAGTEAAIGEIYLFTDADCVVETSWIRRIVRIFDNKKVSLVPSFTNIMSDDAFSNLQAVEWVYLHTLAAGGIGCGQPLGCYGNNLSVRAEDFKKLGGYNTIKFSVTEDLALMQAIFKMKKNISYLIHHEATVNTLPCITFKEFLKQHHRWVIGGLDLGWRAAFFVASSLPLWISLLITLIIGNLSLFFVLIGFRIICDSFLIYPSIIKLKQKRLLIWVLPSTLFIMFLELLAPLMLLWRKVEWKGQHFAKRS